MIERAPELARLAHELRRAGAPAALGDALDAAEVLIVVDGSDRAEVKRALRIAFKVQRPFFDTFDRLFESFWTLSPLDPAAERRETARAIHRPVAAASGPGLAPKPSGVLHWDPEQRILINKAVGEPGKDSFERLPGTSPELLLRRRRLDGDFTVTEQARMRRVLERLAKRLAYAPGRRWVGSEHRVRAYPRASYRRALATDGEVIRLAWRRRAFDRPKLVLLVDTSGSMDGYSRFLLNLVLSLKRWVPGTEVFVFNTELVRITPLLMSRDSDRVLRSLLANVPDWSGGTRLGESLDRFVRRELPHYVDRRTTTIVFSDGLDRGDPGLLERAVRQIQLRSKKLIWLNPLLGHPGYESNATALGNALPYIDHFVAVRDLESLESLLPHLVH